MTREGAGDALCSDPLPAGFSRRVIRVEPGLELDPDASRVLDAMWVVEHGELELECASGTRRRFGRGSMITIARLRMAHVHSVGPGPLVLVAVSRASLENIDEFPRRPGSYVDR